MHGTFLYSFEHTHLKCATWAPCLLNTRCIAFETALADLKGQEHSSVFLIYIIKCKKKNPNWLGFLIKWRAFWFACILHFVNPEAVGVLSPCVLAHLEEQLGCFQILAIMSASWGGAMALACTVTSMPWFLYLSCSQSGRNFVIMSSVLYRWVQFLATLV